MFLDWLGGRRMEYVYWRLSVLAHWRLQRVEKDRIQEADCISRRTAVSGAVVGACRALPELCKNTQGRRGRIWAA